MTSDKKYLWVIHAQSSDEPARLSFYPNQNLANLKNEARKVFPKLATVPNDKICFLEGATVLRNSDRCEKYRLGNSTSFPLILTNKVDGELLNVLLSLFLCHADSYMPFNWLIKILPEKENLLPSSTRDLICCCDVFQRDDRDDEQVLIDQSIRKDIPMEGVINGEVVGRDIL